MSMGGDFYALSDAHLTSLLEGKIDYSDYLGGEADTDKSPRECYARAEHIWYELSQILAPEEGCGVEITQEIPEMASYSYSDEVKSVAEKLLLLGDEEIQDRFDALETEESFAEVRQAVKEVVAFYQRAAANDDAVLFRVT